MHLPLPTSLSSLILTLLIRPTTSILINDTNYNRILSLLPLSRRDNTCPTYYPALRNDPSSTYPILFTIAPASAPLEIGFTLPVPDSDVNANTNYNSDTTNPNSTNLTPRDTGPCTLLLDLSSPSCQVTGTTPPLSASINIYALDGPAPGALVGTTRLADAVQRSVTVNSFACRAQMCFRLEVADYGDGSGGTGDGQQEQVGWVQGQGEGMGFGMRLGC